jgi:hypothetical protein
MKNVKMTVKGNKLIIEVDIDKEFGASKSGKSLIVATTEGNTSAPDCEVKVGLNVYKSINKSVA